MTTPTRDHFAVILQGEERDKAAWERHLDTNFDPRVETVPGRSEKALRSQAFEALATAEDVWRAAPAIFEHINGIMRCIAHASEVRPGQICEVMTDGNVKAYHFLSGHISESADIAGFLTVGAAGSPQAPSPSPAQKWLTAATADPVVADMLKNFGEAPTWVSLFKTYEGIVSLARRTGGYESKSWYPGKVLDEDFRENAHHLHRHGLKDISKPPKRHMDLSTARDLISSMLNSIMSEVAP